MTRGQRLVAVDLLAVHRHDQVAAHADLVEPAHDRDLRGPVNPAASAAEPRSTLCDQQPAFGRQVQHLGQVAAPRTTVRDAQARAARCGRAVWISSSMALARLMGMAKPMPILPCARKWRC